MDKSQKERREHIYKKPMSEPLEKRILSAMDRCKKVVETMRAERQVEPEKLHQPVDL